MRHPLIANSRWGTALLVIIPIALGASIAGCERTPPNAPDAKIAATPPRESPPPAPAMTEGAKSVPPATEGAKGERTANANDPPMKAMTKEEESTSMPQPGQANDHSTLAKDPKK
jgi:hypothetical protein